MKHKYYVQITICDSVNSDNVVFTSNCVNPTDCRVFEGRDGCVDVKEDCLCAAFSCLGIFSNKAKLDGGTYCHIVKKLHNEIYANARDAAGNSPLLVFIYDVSPRSMRDELWQVVVWPFTEKNSECK